jgi:thioesterase domain-containing protein
MSTSPWVTFMNASSDTDPMRNTTALFARASRNSGRVILPINDIALRADAPVPAFYCVHSVSGVAGSDFLDLARRFEPTVRFYGIQAPPIEIEDAEFGSSVESLADHYSDALVKFQPEGPFVLGGYCVGAVIALAMAQSLRARSREVGLLVIIDGAPENTGAPLRHWIPRYWLELARNLRHWIAHGDLVRGGSLQSLMRSLSSNVSAIGRIAIGLKRGQKLGGGYAMDGMMDLSIYPPAHRQFINRLYAALFAYVPTEYPGEVVVYEAKTTPLLYVPQIGRIWRTLASQSEVVGIVGTHISMMHEPYVEALAKNLHRRIAEFFDKFEARRSDHTI